MTVKAEVVQAWARERARDRACKKLSELVVALVLLGAVCILIMYYISGCGACENDATCRGLFGECICVGNNLGEHCENSCGEFGQVNGGACVCTGRHLGKYCEHTCGDFGQLNGSACACVGGYTGTFCDLPPDGDSEAGSGLGAGWIVLIILLSVGCFAVVALACLWLLLHLVPPIKAGF